MNTQTRTAELIDRIYTVIAGCALLMALFMASEAIAHFVEGNHARFVYYAGRVLMGLALAGFAWVLFLGIRKRTLIWQEKASAPDEEGFVPQMLRKAMAISWAVTLIFISQIDRFLAGVTDGLTGNDILMVSGEIAMALMLGIFALAFFALNGFSGGFSGEDAA